MSYKKTLMPERLMIATGLLLVTTPTLINDWVHLPDFVRGAFFGLGLGLETIGLIYLKRKRAVDSGC
jgi:hypothetical protein